MVSSLSDCDFLRLEVLERCSDARLWCVCGTAVCGLRWGVVVSRILG